MIRWSRPAGKWLNAAKWWLKENHHMKAASALCGCLSCLEAWKENDPDDNARVDLGRQVFDMTKEINWERLKAGGFQERLVAMDLVNRALIVST